MSTVVEARSQGYCLASLRKDPLGKGMAQIRLSMPIHVPRHLLTA